MVAPYRVHSPLRPIDDLMSTGILDIDGNGGGSSLDDFAAYYSFIPGRSVRRWKDEGDFIPPLTGRPTAAPPGTVEKLEVFELRIGRGEELFHPYDARYDGDIRPLLYYLGEIEGKTKRQRLRA